MDHEFLSCGILTGFLSLLVARTLADLLPFRERPMHAAGLHFQMPYASNESMIHWSSFPSDHAALFFALALSLLFVSRRAGIAALCYTFLIVCLPRVYTFGPTASCQTLLLIPKQSGFRQNSALFEEEG